jgi:prolyl 4-hydroxylase
MISVVAGLRLVVLKNFLTPVECEHLIALGRNRIRPSTTLCPETGREIFVPGRTSNNTYLLRQQTPIVADIERRIAGQSGLPVKNGEGLQLLNYQVGQQYLPHFDFFDPERPGNAQVLANGGQRVASCILYLNTVEAGGETIFPEVDETVQAIQGDAVLFYNLTPEGQPDPLSLHGSTPVITGEKWVATKWIREREYQ